MDYQVPQYIDIEDKIVGPFTLKQFIYLLIGAGVLFLLYTFLKFSAFIIVGSPIAIFSILMAFYKPSGNIKFGKFVAGFLKFIGKPNIYTWKKKPSKKEEEPLPKIIKKAETKKQIPEENKLEEIEWKIEIQNK